MPTLKVIILGFNFFFLFTGWIIEFITTLRKVIMSDEKNTNY